MLRTLLSSSYTHEWRKDSSYELSVMGSVNSSGASLSASNALSAANMPDFIAVCVPLIFGTFNMPAVSPTSTPPGNASFGMD